MCETNNICVIELFCWNACADTVDDRPADFGELIAGVVGNVMEAYALVQLVQSRLLATLASIIHALRICVCKHHTPHCHTR